MIAFFIMPCVARAAPGDRFVWIDQDFAARPRSCGQVAWICGTLPADASAHQVGYLSIWRSSLHAV